LNWQSPNGDGTGPDMSQWNKNKLWDYLLAANLHPHASPFDDLVGSFEYR